MIEKFMEEERELDHTIDRIVKEKEPTFSEVLKGIMLPGVGKFSSYFMKYIGLTGGAASAALFINEMFSDANLQLMKKMSEEETNHYLNLIYQNSDAAKLYGSAFLVSLSLHLVGSFINRISEESFKEAVLKHNVDKDNIKTRLYLWKHLNDKK